MALEIRPNTIDEFKNLKQTNARASGLIYSDSDIDTFRLLFDPERSLCAFENGKIVGNVASYYTDMTIPGGTFLPTAGVAQVSVQATHRRKGILTMLMRRQLNEINERDEPIAFLGASETAIYGRFGYGVSSFIQEWEFDKHNNTKFINGFNPKGQIQFIEIEDAKKIFPDVYEKIRPSRPGFVSRKRANWDNNTGWDWVFKKSTLFGQNPNRFFIKYTVNSETQGYAIYKVNQTGPFAGELTIMELMALNIDAYKSLWRFCLDMDLVNTVKAPDRPLDDPILWMLQNSRRKRTLTDSGWLRIVNAEKALAKRAYSFEGEINLQIEDKVCDWNDGIFNLQGSPLGAKCNRSSEKADIVISASSLASIYFGTTSFSNLFSAGLVEENTPGSIQIADSMFRTNNYPWFTDIW